MRHERRASALLTNQHHLLEQSKNKKRRGQKLSAQTVARKNSAADTAITVRRQLGDGGCLPQKETSSQRGTREEDGSPGTIQSSAILRASSSSWGIATLRSLTCSP